MRLLSFRAPDGVRPGVLRGERGDRVVDLRTADPALPEGVRGILEAGPEALEAVARAAERADSDLPLDELPLAAPVPDPRKFLAIGRNYRDHILELGNALPEFPLFFNKQVTCVNGPYDPVHYPEAVEKLDYEGELGVVIGRRCRAVPRERALDVIAGYVVVNDVTSRDWQARAATMTLGKSFDTHGPFGPWLTTADEIDDPHDLRVTTRVNGSLRQDYSTGNMVFDLFEQIAVLSTVFTLEPGDVVSAGTSSGVGAAMDPPGFLSVGDVVRVEIEGLGWLENPIVEEPPEARGGA